MRGGRTQASAIPSASRPVAVSLSPPFVRCYFGRYPGIRQRFSDKSASDVRAEDSTRRSLAGGGDRQLSASFVQVSLPLLRDTVSAMAVRTAQGSLLQPAMRSALRHSGDVREHTAFDREEAASETTARARVVLVSRSVPFEPARRNVLSELPIRLMSTSLIAPLSCLVATARSARAFSFRGWPARAAGSSC